MFRRKEESLFDNELLEETDSFTVQPAANAAASAPAAPQSPVAAAAPVSPVSPVSAPQAATTVAPSAANVQPITRPASVPPVAPAAATNFRPAQPVSAQPAPAAVSNTPVSRPTEVKSMNPQNNPLSAPTQAQNSAKASNRVLTVGNDILLKGEINSCDRLVIEGKLEATLNDVHTMELAECGSFKGSANVVDAQISGLFEGDLVVTGRLVIYASGKVRGNISYGEIEIERGGELSGSIKMGAASQAPKAVRKEAA